MLSALILSRLGYPAVLLAEQPVRQWPVRHGPLVLMPNPRKFLRPQQIETELSHDGADIEVPNHSVDMSSWEGSACYPRSTFYPLSDGLSMQCRRITMP